MDDQLILKNRLKVARAEKGLSQTQLAELVGVSRNTISSIETGQFNPTAKLALVLCIALDKKFEDLFYFCPRSPKSAYFTRGPAGTKMVLSPRDHFPGKVVFPHDPRRTAPLPPPGPAG